MADIYNDPGHVDLPGAGAETPSGTAYRETEVPPPGPVVRKSVADLGDMPAWQRTLTEWVRENQILAMASGFAIGVFIGVLMRD